MKMHGKKHESETTPVTGEGCCGKTAATGNPAGQKTNVGQSSKIGARPRVASEVTSPAGLVGRRRPMDPVNLPAGASPSAPTRGNGSACQGDRGCGPGALKTPHERREATETGHGPNRGAPSRAAVGPDTGRRQIRCGVFDTNAAIGKQPVDDRTDRRVALYSRHHDRIVYLSVRKYITCNWYRALADDYRDAVKMLCDDGDCSCRNEHELLSVYQLAIVTTNGEIIDLIFANEAWRRIAKRCGDAR
jgi:hypothetical protein